MRTSLKNLVRRLFPRNIKPHRILGGPLRGKVIVASWHDYPAGIMGLTERPLLDWFRANVRSGDTWLDVGAHYGYTALALAELVTRSGRVFAFEPMLGTAGHLAATRRLNAYQQISIVPFALASVDGIGVAELPTTRGMVDSTLSTNTALTEQFLLSSIDFLWPKIAGANQVVSGVKIDVQGMEIEALRGMANTVRKYRPKIVVEVHEGVDRRVLLELISSLGYSIEATPVEPVDGEHAARFIDNRSYAFRPAQAS
jgi:FkbM family methyltransferase